MHPEARRAFGGYGLGTPSLGLRVLLLCFGITSLLLSSSVSLAAHLTFSALFS